MNPDQNPEPGRNPQTVLLLRVPGNMSSLVYRMIDTLTHTHKHTDVEKGKNFQVAPWAGKKSLFSFSVF